MTAPNNNTSSTYFRIESFLIIAISALALGSCSAKYAPKLNSVSSEGREAIRPTEMFYVENMIVSSPLAEAYMSPGSGHLAAMSYFVKESGTVDRKPQGVLQYRRRTDYRMLLPLPAKLIPGEIELDNSAFVRDYSNVEVSLSERTFLFTRGTFSIDSIKSSDLYTSIDAMFRSLKGDSLKYDGQMKFVARKRFQFRNVIYQRQQ